jgi:putative addiction module antidote
MTKVKLTSIGNSVGIVLPKEVLTRLRVGKGDTLSIVETVGGVTLSPFDPEFERQMDLAEEIMREDRDVLRKLAQ